MEFKGSVRFNKGLKNQENPFDTFVHDLYRLADNCDYGTLKYELIPDLIVVGVIDNSLSDLLESIPYTAQAVQMSHQAESRAENLDFVRGDNKPAPSG